MNALLFTALVIAAMGAMVLVLSGGYWLLHAYDSSAQILGLCGVLLGLVALVTIPSVWRESKQQSQPTTHWVCTEETAP